MSRAEFLSSLGCLKTVFFQSWAAWCACSFNLCAPSSAFHLFMKAKILGSLSPLYYAPRGRSQRFGAIWRVSFWCNVCNIMFAIRACNFPFIAQQLCWKVVNLQHPAGDNLSTLGCLRASVVQRWLVYRRQHLNIRSSTGDVLSGLDCIRQIPFQHWAICQ